MKMYKEKPTLRDFIVTNDEWIFAVCDYCHPKGGVRAILRYVPDSNGTRRKKNSNISYRKLDFDESYSLMKETKPKWIKDVAVVPETEIKKVLKPRNAVFRARKKPDEYETLNKIIRFFHAAGVPYNAMGVTGSVLAELNNSESDIDFIVYGKHWKTAQSAMKSVNLNSFLPQNGKKSGIQTKQNDFGIQSLTDDMWRKVYKKRKSPLSFETFVRHESRKNNRGMADGIYFDILYVRSENEQKAPILRGRDMGLFVAEAIVSDDTYAFDSPAVYKINHPEYTEILSYTHAYAGQAVSGEKIRVSGVEEKVGKTKRLVVGTSREPENEWIVSCTLMNLNQSDLEIS